MKGYMAFMYLWIAFLAISVVCISCRPVETSGGDLRPNEIRTAPCGFEYTIVEIEDHKFLAYQSSYGFWEVTLLE